MTLGEREGLTARRLTGLTLIEVVGAYQYICGTYQRAFIYLLTAQSSKQLPTYVNLIMR